MTPSFPRTGVSGHAGAVHREKQDTTSAVLLEKIVADEEEHIDYLETQLELMDKLGEELYSAQCVSRPPT
ncbi:bacterioferritin [Mycobacterium tuberculosis]|nr:bacterioferritin [Mycobacterium tuberculosis]